MKVAPPSARLFELLGAVQAAQGDRAAAESAYVSATRLEPTRAEARVALANFYAGSGSSGPALAQLEQAIRADPRNPSAFMLMGTITRSKATSRGRSGHSSRRSRSIPHMPRRPTISPGYWRNTVGISLARWTWPRVRTRPNPMIHRSRIHWVGSCSRADKSSAPSRSCSPVRRSFQRAAAFSSTTAWSRSSLARQPKRGEH